VVVLAAALAVRPLFHEIAHAGCANVSRSPCFLVGCSRLDIQPVQPVHAVGRILSGMNAGGDRIPLPDRGGHPPVRDILPGMFFISVGMLLDVRYVDCRDRAGYRPSWWHVRVEGAILHGDAAVYDDEIQALRNGHRDFNPASLVSRAAPSVCSSTDTRPLASRTGGAGPVDGIDPFVLKTTSDRTLSVREEGPARDGKSA